MSEHYEVASAISRVAWMMDHDDVDGFWDCWCPDATLHHSTADGQVTRKAGTEIHEMASAVFGNPAYAPFKSLHIVNNPAITIDGAWAVAHYYVLHTLMGPGAKPLGLEECRTELVKCEDGRWRIKSLLETQLLDYAKV